MKIKKRILTILIVFAMCIGCLPVYAEDNSTYSDSAETSAPAETSDPVEAFVERLYTNILQRDPDADGLQDWTNVLKSGSGTGSQGCPGIY